MEKKFAKGIILKKIGKYNDIKMSVNLEKFACDENEFNDNGWGNFIIRISKDGKPYCIIDEWKPTKKEEQKDIVEFKEVNSDSLPF